MKSKAIIYLLGFSVLCIWGVILFRIFLSMGDNGGEANLANKATPAKKAGVPKLYPDSFTLLMDYPDPFTGVTAISIDTSKVSLSKPSGQPIEAQINPVQEMKYLGYVRGGQGRNGVAIISYNGKERMMEKGDTIVGATLTLIQRNMVGMRYKDRTIMIKAE